MHNHGREKKECVVWMRKQKKLKNNKKYRKVKGTVDTHTHTRVCCLAERKKNQQQKTQENKGNCQSLS